MFEGGVFLVNSPDIKMKLEMENMEFKLSIDVFESVIRILDQILINLKVGWILQFWAKIRFFMQNFKKKQRYEKRFWMFLMVKTPL